MSDKSFHFSVHMKKILYFDSVKMEPTNYRSGSIKAIFQLSDCEIM
jgi:hypothetical protein